MYTKILKMTMIASMFVFTSAATSAPSFGGGAFTYDSDAEGWKQVFTDNFDANDLADHSSSMGRPAGSIFQSVGTSGDRAYSLALSESPNSMGDLTGLTLQTDIRSTGNWLGNTAARWFILEKVNDSEFNTYVSKHVGSVALGFTSWETHSIELVEANFFRWPNSDISTGDSDHETFDSLIAGPYTSIGMVLTTDDSDNPTFWGNNANIDAYGSWADSGTAKWGLDNFQAVPEPASVALLGIGGLALLRRRCRG